MQYINIHQTEATLLQYIFCFILINIIFIITNHYKYRQKKITASWVLIIIFCLFAFWDPDYFTFKERFYTSLEDFRDPLYYLITLISFNSYTFFRLIIWGIALYTFNKTLKKFAIHRNMALFLFSILTLGLFSQMRCSLGLTMYCYGLSLIMMNKNISTLIFGVVLICLSYYGHRSMILPIVLTPMIYIKPNKLNIIIVLISLILIGQFAGIFLTNINSGIITIDTSSEFAGSVDALEHYASMEAVVVSNWKYTLTLMLRRHSFTIVYLYCLWLCYFSKEHIQVPKTMKQLMFVISALFIIGVSFMYVGNMGANVIGERLLFYIGIPLCIILTSLKTLGLCKSWIYYFSLSPAFLFIELFIFGKILSF